jgi:hypothetical protein
MFIGIYFFLLPICSFVFCVFGFFVGRCARRLPIVDNGLPWAISRSQITHKRSRTARIAASARCSDGGGPREQRGDPQSLSPNLYCRRSASCAIKIAAEGEQ